MHLVAHSLTNHKRYSNVEKVQDYQIENKRKQTKIKKILTTMKAKHENKQYIIQILHVERTDGQALIDD